MGRGCIAVTRLGSLVHPEVPAPPDHRTGILIMAGPRRISRLGLRLAVAVGIASLALGVFLTQTLWGKELVLREILRRAEGVFEGELSVEGISSPGLLRGFTLRGVRLTGADGRPFLLADSVMAGVSPRTLLAGDLILSRVEFWSPAVTLERLPDRERMNVMEIFLPRREDETPAGVMPEPIPVESTGMNRLPPASVGSRLRKRMRTGLSFWATMAGPK